MRVRDGPAAVRGDALPPRRHWAPRPGKAAGEGAPSQNTCRPPQTRTPRGRRIRAPSFPRIPRDPRDRPRRRLAVDGGPPTRARCSPADRLPLADRDGGPVRDRRRPAGGRRRPGLGLPEERAAHVAHGPRPERRGDRELPPRPRRHLLRRPVRQAAGRPRDPRRRRGGAEDDHRRVPGDQAAGHGSRATARRRRRSPLRWPGSCGAIVRSVPRSEHLRLYDELDPTYYSATSQTFIGRIYKLFGFENIADAADKEHTGYPQLSAEYILKENPQIIVLADAQSRPRWRRVPAGRRSPRSRTTAWSP